MKYFYNTKQFLTILRASGRECNAASPFRTLCALNYEPEQPVSLSQEEQLIAAFAAQPEQVIVCGRHSAADGDLYLLRIGAVWYLYQWLEKQDIHAFFAYCDRPGLIRMLEKNFCAFYRPNFGAYTQLQVTLSETETLTWELIRALHAGRARQGNGVGSNEAFRADDLKQPDIAAYLRNSLDELGFSAVSQAIDALMDESNHEVMEAALQGLESKGILSPDLALTGEGGDPAYCLSRTAIERLDDGMLIDTLRVADKTDPAAVKEILFCLRRDGVLAFCPVKRGAVLRTFPVMPWDEIL